MLSPLEIKIVKRLQEDIPIVEEPYKQIASEIGISQKELMDKIDEFLKKGVLRRFGAIVRHTNVGFKSNVLVVWKVPEDKIEQVVKIMTSFKEISHCYKRKSCRKWQYNIYTMIHGENKACCENTICNIVKLSGVKEFEALYTLRELKKKSMKYFV